LKPPVTITVKSDGNVLTFKDTLKPKIGDKEVLYIYEYTKSKTKKGTLLGLTESQLLKLISTNL
jgi:hypothetical protein